MFGKFLCQSLSSSGWAHSSTLAGPIHQAEMRSRDDEEHHPVLYGGLRSFLDREAGEEVAIGGLEDVDVVAGRAVVDGVLAGNRGHIHDEAAVEAGIDAMGGRGGRFLGAVQQFDERCPACGACLSIEGHDFYLEALRIACRWDLAGFNVEALALQRRAGDAAALPL